MATVRRAEPADWPAIAALLRAAQLPLDGAETHLDAFVVAAREDGAITGAGGLELYGEVALLRSLVVEPRGTGLGSSLVARLIEDARTAGVRDLVLMTTTASGFFPRFGFAATTREAVPEALRASEEFRGACPASATVMHLRLS
jgi:amino-acid N-acetyltransferase